MKYIFLLFILTACANVNTPSYDPINNDEYIEQLEAQNDQKIKADTLQVYAYLGAALFASGVAMLAFTPRVRSGLIMLLGGLVAMGTPFVFNSPWWNWSIGLFVFIVFADGLYLLFRKTAEYISSKRNNSDS